MSCLKTLTGLGRSCESNIPGLRTVYFANREDVSDVAFEADGITVSAITMATEAKFYKYYFAKNTGSLVTTHVRSDENGNNYYTTTINLQFNKMEAAKHVEIEALAEGNLIAVAVDNNGKAHLVGYDDYLSSQGEEIATSGAGIDDRNGYTLTLTATEQKIGRILKDISIMDQISVEPGA